MDKILKEDFEAVKEFMQEKINNNEHKLFTGDSSEVKVVQVINVINEVERLQEENRNLKFANQVLNRRLKHLLQSKTIQEYDTKKYFTDEYKFNIKNLDNQINRLCKYYQKDMELCLLTGYYLENLIDSMIRGDIMISDQSTKGIF